MNNLRLILSLSILFFTSLSCSTGTDPVYTLKTSVSPEEGGSVSPAQGVYDSGSDVKLMASPNQHWVLQSWQGDNSLKGNPATVKMDSDKNIMAVFVKRDYSLTVNVDGEGSVSERIVQQKTTDYPHSTVVELTANGADGWGFRAWKNAVNSTQNPITIIVENETDITAVFDECVTDGCLDIYFSQTSYLTTKPYFHKNFNDFYTGWHMPLEAVVLDYDQDGYMDLVHTNSDYDASFAGQGVRNSIQFFKGDSQGNFHIDHTLTGKFKGLHHGRKGIVGDFTNNGYPDIVFVGHGVDIAPYPGEYPIILLNENGKDFSEIRLTELVSFWHSVASGDINNDGNLDIVLVDPFINHGGGVILWNDGTGNFTIQKDVIPMKNAVSQFTSELFDIDKDGYLDLLLPFNDNNNGQPSLIYGNGQNFLGSSVSLPHVPGYGIAVDVDIYDINGDGNYEIIVNRTSDGTLEEFPDWYSGWYIQILELTGDEYTDATDKFITDYTHATETWISWLHLSERKNDGVLRLYSNEVDHSEPRYEWELRYGKFVRVK